MMTARSGAEGARNLSSASVYTPGTEIELRIFFIFGKLLLRNFSGCEQNVETTVRLPHSRRGIILTPWFQVLYLGMTKHVRKIT
jgi:hypothetical protein